MRILSIDPRRPLFALFRRTRQGFFPGLALVAASLLFATVSAAQDSAPPAGADADCRLPAELAAGLLRGEVSAGDLPLDARFVIDEALLLESDRLQAMVEGRLDVAPLEFQEQVAFCVFLLLDVDGEPLLASRERLEIDDFASVESVRVVLKSDLPQGTRQMNLVVHESLTGTWGAMPLEQPSPEVISGPSFTAVRLAEAERGWYETTRRVGAAPTDGGGWAAAGGTAVDKTASGEPAVSDPAPEDAEAVPPAPSPASVWTGAVAPTPRGEEVGPVLRLVPPAARPAVGSTIVECLVSSVAVDRVVFELDGQQVGVDNRPPYRARMRFDRPAREQTVRAIAYDSLGEVMDVDVMLVNRSDAPLRVQITSLAVAGQEATVEADVSIPSGTQLDRVEVWSNETLVETLQAPPWRSTLSVAGLRPDDPQSTDYVRVAVFLADGATIDDVRLLAAPGPVDVVDVNLVQLHVVVTDGDGRPVDDLTLDQFTVVTEEGERAPEQLAYADDVPLILGLMVDASGSMEILMHDTKRAAAKFLGQTVLPQDRAFLVDYDLQPRLLAAPSGDLPSLMRDLGKLQAAGRTAMYDAVVFSLLQYAGQPGRRALVVLSDGDDLDSRFGPKAVAERARLEGVPVYVIGLGALDIIERRFSKADLRKLSEGTGGRLYFVDSFEELDGAYAQINAELRSQYTLSFYVEDDLDAEARQRLQVKVPKPYSARVVVGLGSEAQ